MPTRQYLNQAKFPSFKGHTVQVSLVRNATQSNEIATLAISQPGLTPWF